MSTQLYYKTYIHVQVSAVNKSNYKVMCTNTIVWDRLFIYFYIFVDSAAGSPTSIGLVAPPEQLIKI